MTEKKLQQNKSLSIRVTTNGLSFCSYTPASATPFIYRQYDVQPTISLAANLKHALMNEPMLKEEYRRVNVLISSPNFTTVPVAMFKPEEVEDTYRYVFPKDTPQHISYNVLRRSGLAIVFGIDRNIYQLIVDDFPRARFYASPATLIDFFSEKSMIGAGKDMFAYLHDGTMTLYVISAGKVDFINSFQVKETSDCQYFILNVWQHLGLDQTQDALHIVGDTGEESQLEQAMQNFIRETDVTQRSEDFQGRITSGNTLIPYDLQTLLVCGF